MMIRKIKKIGNIENDKGFKDPQRGRVYSPEGLSPALDNCGGGNREIKVAIPCLTPERLEKRQNGRRFKEDGEPMFTLTAQDRHGVAVGGCMEDSLKIAVATKQGYREAKPGDGVDLKYPDSKTRRGRVQEGGAQTLQGNDLQGVVTENLRIRKLTPKECFRLQGWTDDYFIKAQFVNSDSQLYKQAGNGVTVNVITYIGDLINQAEEAESE